MSLITPSTHCKYSTMHLKSFQRFNISSFKGTRYYIKAPVNNYFTRVFLFFHDLANLNLRFDIILHIILLYKAFSPLVNNANQQLAF